MDVPVLNATAASPLAGLTTILDAGRPLAVAERKLATDVSAVALCLAVGEARSERFAVPERTPTQIISGWVVAALTALAGGASDDASLDALAADAMAQIEAAWQLREGLDRIVPLRYRQQPLRVRIERVDSDGCRLFHVDQVVLRMICTWHGAGSEWLPEHAFDRAGLGCGCNDHVRDMGAIRRIPTGAVAVMKGDRFPGEAGRGLVHRSPPASPARPRLLMVVDVA